MERRPRVWFVDDLRNNLQRFQRDHSDHFDIELFTDRSAVLRRIHYPDALLCDVFFYDTPDEICPCRTKGRGVGGLLCLRLEETMFFRMMFYSHACYDTALWRHEPTIRPPVPA
jgi:hypothetical protein